jgi:hypothetical protein
VASQKNLQHVPTRLLVTEPQREQLKRGISVTKLSTPTGGSSVEVVLSDYAEPVT